MQDDTSTGITTRTPPVRTTTSSYSVVVVTGPDVGTSFLVDGSSPARVYLGHGPTCELKVSDRRISRRHAAFALAEGGLRVTDLDSTNGTFVAGVRVFDALLTDGEIVTAGESTFRIDAAGAREVSLSAAESFGRVVGASAEMRRLYPLLETLAASDVPVVIEGETGTGKEALAEAIHEASPRAAGPFVVFDCTAVAPTLVESELFGHERGAFTGAMASRKGLFEQADGGTLFIDELGDLDPTMQPKLLRAVERMEVRRVGGDKWIKVNTRIIAATRRDLDREVQDGRFRDDLFFRLAVARIELPPLRARRGDIAHLTRHFWKRLGGLGEPPYELLRRFERMPWYGNIRELANAVSRCIALGEQNVQAEPAPTGHGDAMEEVLALDLPYPRARDRILAEFENRYVKRVLTLHNGNVTRAAEASGIGRRYFTTLVSRTGKP
ncbi:sigma 54-interacting transcriptional regulator [Labilithrix luteola]|nr:sigma 54-interacting transcriptional regulator [Labilithrix luteola]